MKRLALLLLLVSGLAGCRHDNTAVKREELPEVRVKTAPATIVERTQYEEVVGTVRPKINSIISAKISGKVEKLAVASGQTVRAGELMVELEAADIRAKMGQAQALANQAETDLRRYTKLLPQNAVTQADYDNAYARAQVARAALSEAETMLSYAQIRAPFSGIVTKRFVDLGSLAAPGVPLLELQSPGALRFEAEVPEAVMGRIKIEDKLQVLVAHRRDELGGAVSEIVPAADPLSRTFLVKLDLPEVENLFAGQFGKVRVPVGEVSSVQVPQSAVVRRGQLEIVFVLQNGRAWLRLVKTGKELGGNIEVLSGLDQGEVVVLSGALQLQDGQQARIEA